MAESYSKRILAYCESRGIVVPPGFHRHPASRYAVVDTGKAPPRLIATTWFKQEDLLYYVQRHPEPHGLSLLDFREWQELVLDGKQLKATGQRLQADPKASEPT